MDSLQPVGARMEQLLPCTFQEVPDGLLGNAIWKVGIDPTEGELFLCIMACLLEGVVIEVSIVAVIMEDLDSMFCSILIDGEHDGKCFVGLVVELEVDESEAAIVANEDGGGALVALLGKFAFQSCIKSHFH